LKQDQQQRGYLFGWKNLRLVPFSFKKSGLRKRRKFPMRFVTDFRTQWIFILTMINSYFIQRIFQWRSSRFHKYLQPLEKKCEKYSKIRSCFAQPRILDKLSLLEETPVIPLLEDFGFSAFEHHSHSVFPFKGGTLSALGHLENYFWNTKRLSYYKQTRNGLVGTHYSSKFSPWLANGSLSARMIYWEIMSYEREIEKNESTYWLIFELIWRDYFKYISLKHGHSFFHLGGILKKEYSWNTKPDFFLKWVEGKTAEPFVNANMIELKKTGFMSNRGRQNVASYFAKNMLMDWRMGAAYFEQQLIDYDVHSNWGNWMYVAGVGNDPRDRKFNIKIQAERYDPKGQYQKLWLQNTLFE